MVGDGRRIALCGDVFVDGSDASIGKITGGLATVEVYVPVRPSL